jgi:hypothetical protein
LLTKNFMTIEILPVGRHLYSESGSRREGVAAEAGGGIIGTFTNQLISKLNLYLALTNPLQKL